MRVLLVLLLVLGLSVLGCPKKDASTDGDGATTMPAEGSVDGAHEGSEEEMEDKVKDAAEEAGKAVEGLLD